MPIKPGIYEPDGTANGGTGINVGPSRSGGDTGGSLQPAYAHAMNLKKPTALSDLVKVGGLVVNAIAEQDKIATDNVIDMARLETKVGLASIRHQLDQEGIGTGPGAYRDYENEFANRAAKFLDEQEKRLGARVKASTTFLSAGSDKMAMDAFRRLTYGEVLVQRFGAQLRADELLKEDTFRTYAVQKDIAIKQAANLGLGEQPIRPGDKLYAFGDLDSLHEKLDQMVRANAISADKAQLEKDATRKAAIHARARVLAFDAPETFLKRSNTPGDLFEQMDTEQRVTLQGFAEQRYHTLVEARDKLRKQQDDFAARQQKASGEFFRADVDRALLTDKNLVGFKQQLLDSEADMGPEEFSKSMHYLRTAELAKAEGRDKPKVNEIDSALRKNQWQTSIYAKGGDVDISEMRRDVIEGRMRPEVLDDLTLLAHNQREDVRKDWHKAEFERLAGQLGSPKLPGYLSKLGEDKLGAVAAAAEYALHSWIIANPKHDRAQLSAATTEIISRYAPVLDKYAENPASLLHALPKNKTTGQPFTTEQEVLDSDLPRSIKDEALNIFRWVEARKGKKTGPRLAPTGSEEQPQPDSTPATRPNTANPAYRKSR